MTLQDVLTALASGDVQEGPCRDTDPLQRPVPGLPCGLVGVSAGATAAYVQRTMARREAMQQLDELCFWHLFLVEVPPDFRVITAARRTLHLRLQKAQREDDQAVLKTAGGGQKWTQ